MDGLRDHGVDDLVGISEAARLLGVTEGTVRKWSNAGRVPSQRTPGRQRRFRVGDLRDFVAAGKRATSEAGDAGEDEPERVVARGAA